LPRSVVAWAKTDKTLDELAIASIAMIRSFGRQGPQRRQAGNRGN
jgi:hypothetical protein